MCRHLLFLCILTASAALGRAQSPVSCTAESVNPAVVSSEGVAELVSDYVIHCHGGVPTPAGQPIPRITLHATTNGPLTSKLLTPLPTIPPSLLPLDQTPPPAGPPPPPYTPQLTEALLLIDAPAPNVQLPCPTLPCSIQGTGGSTNPYDGSAGHYNVFQAMQTGTNQLVWDGVPFDPPGTGKTRTLRITDVRANLEFWSKVQCLGCAAGLVIGFISSPDLMIGNPQQTLAYGRYGLSFQSTTALIPPFTSHNSTEPAADFLITFREGFPNSFKPRTIAPHPDDASFKANQNTPGKTYATTSGFYNASFTGTYAGAGLATQGTRLVARFENVPAGVSLFVTAQPIAPSDTLRVQLVSTGPQGEGPYQPIQQAENGFAQLAVSNGVAIAVWEVTSASPTTLETAQFGAGVSFSANPGAPFVQMGTTTVTGSLGPLTSVTLASATDPVPRFVEGLRSRHSGSALTSRRALRPS